MANPSQGKAGHIRVKAALADCDIGPRRQQRDLGVHRETPLGRIQRDDRFHGFAQLNVQLDRAFIWLIKPRDPRRVTLRFKPEEVASIRRATERHFGQSLAKLSPGKRRPEPFVGVPPGFQSAIMIRPKHSHAQLEARQQFPGVRVADHSRDEKCLPQGDEVFLIIRMDQDIIRPLITQTRKNKF